MATWVSTPVVLNGATGPTGPGSSGSSSGAVMISAGWDSGGTGAVLRSVDRGVTWSDVGLTGISAFRATAVAYNGVSWILSTDTEILFSNDGLSWTVESGLFSAANFIKWNGKQFVASTSDSAGVTVFTSANGISWASKPVDGLSGQTAGGAATDPVLSDVASDGSIWIGALDGISPNGYPFIISTDNGATWTDDGITGAGGFMERAYGISYAEGVWVATGSSATDATTAIMRSTDGLQWTPVAGDTDTDGFGLTGGGSYVASNGVQWVAVGGGDADYPTILTSSDNAQTWSNAGVSGDINSPSGTNIYFNSVKWNGFYWVAVGTPPNQITYSVDGLTWVSATAEAFPGNYVGEVATDYIQSILGGVGNAGGGGKEGPVGPTGMRGTVIYYGYGGPTGTAGYIAPGPTGYGPVGPGIEPQKTGDFYLDFNDGRLYLTP